MRSGPARSKRLKPVGPEALCGSAALLPLSPFPFLCCCNLLFGSCFLSFSPFSHACASPHRICILAWWLFLAAAFPHLATACLHSFCGRLACFARARLRRRAQLEARVPPNRISNTTIKIRIPFLTKLMSREFERQRPVPAIAICTCMQRLGRLREDPEVSVLVKRCVLSDHESELCMVSF